MTLILHGFGDSVGKGYADLKERILDLGDAAGATVRVKRPKIQNPTSDLNVDDKEITTLSEPIFIIPTAGYLDCYSGSQIQEFQVRKVEWLFEHLCTCRRPQEKRTKP